MPIKQPGSPNPPLSMSEIYNEESVFKRTK